jgi:hypothetical protein
MKDLRTYTVGELIALLNTFDRSKPVVLLDADTDWYIHKFHVVEDDKEVTFFPCPYVDMEQR